MNFLPIVLMAVIVEGLITYLQQFIKMKKLCWQMIISIIVGVFCTVAYEIDLFALFGMSTSIPFLGNVLTGILISRGSNYIFDLIKQVNGIVNSPADKDTEVKSR